MPEQESASGKLPVDKPQPPALPDAEVSARLGTAARDWALQVSAVADTLAAFASTLAEIAARLGADLEKQIGEISDGAGDDGAAAG